MDETVVNSKKAQQNSQYRGSSGPVNQATEPADSGVSQCSSHPQACPQGCPWEYSMTAAPFDFGLQVLNSSRARQFIILVVFSEGAFFCGSVLPGLRGTLSKPHWPFQIRCKDTLSSSFTPCVRWQCSGVNSWLNKPKNQPRSLRFTWFGLVDIWRESWKRRNSINNNIFQELDYQEVIYLIKYNPGNLWDLLFHRPSRMLKMCTAQPDDSRVTAVTSMLLQLISFNIAQLFTRLFPRASYLQGFVDSSAIDPGVTLGASNQPRQPRPQSTMHAQTRAFSRHLCKLAEAMSDSIRCY